MTPQQVLEVRNLDISYLRRRAALHVVSDLSFTIAPGEAYALVGESGCGKTTAALAVMQHLARNARIDGGSILFEGRELLGIAPEELRELRGSRMAMVSQSPGTSLNPSMPVGKQIAEIYHYHRGMPRRDALGEAVKMLETVQMPDAPRLARRYPHQLSGGQQQRVMIAMALATNPALLVLDEPTTGLDATVEAEVIELVSSLRSEVDAAILFISHNLGIVSRLCDRIGVLYSGELVEEGTVADTLLSPRHPYTLGLLRSIPRPGADKHRQRLIPIGGGLPPLGSVISGCTFAPRCPIAQDVCREAPVPLLEIPGRFTRCLFPDRVPEIPVTESIGREAARTEGPPAPVLAVTNVTKAYVQRRRRLVAVDGVSLEIFPGEFFGLVGESGSGKTSLARCVAGLTEASDGLIEIAGQALPLSPGRRTTDQRRLVQMVFQNPDGALNPRHSVRRIIGRAIKRLSRDRAPEMRAVRLTDLATAVRLGQEHLDVTPESLSGGLKQRVAIARALAGHPALVVCDEPTSALDVSIQAAILNLLVDLRDREDVAYLFISHDLATVRYLADRVAVMYLGQIIETGTAKEVFSPPYHPYTEALLSASPAVGQTEVPRITLHGVLPDPADPPPGCRFHTRCPRYLGDICREQVPPWQELNTSLRYRCHIPPAELARDQEETPWGQRAAQREADSVIGAKSAASSKGGGTRPGVDA
jgi:peptide/nickel transport system ATP-binding protein